MNRLVIDGPAPIGYGILRDGPSGETLHDILIDLPRTTAADAKRAVRSGLARLDAAEETFAAQWRAREDRAGRSYTEMDRKSDDVRWHDRMSGYLCEANIRLGTIEPVLRHIPDDSGMGAHDGSGWVQIEQALLLTEKIAVGLGMIRDAATDTTK